MKATTYHRTFLTILVVAITFAFLLVMRTFVVTLILAGVFTVMVYPAYRRVVSWCRGRTRLAAVICMVAIVLMIVVPAAVFVGVLVSQGVEVSAGAGAFIQKQMASGEWSDRLSNLPLADRLLPYRDELLKKGSEAAAAVARFVVGKLSDVTRGTVSVIVHLVLMIYAMYFFLLDGPGMLRSAMSRLPLSPGEKKRIMERFTSVSVATLKSTVIIGVVQGSLGGVGFAVAGIPGAAFWGTVMTIFAMIPGIGTALVWVPAAVYLLVVGKTVTAIVLAAYFILVVGMIDNLLRPRLVGRGSQMHELLVLLSTLGGLMAFGVVGFILGPVVAALFLTLWDIHGEAMGESAGETGDA